ncbi:hypothetical protein GCM10010493_75200 [Streptomyces lavendulae subsp. grasserius]
MSRRLRSVLGNHSGAPFRGSRGTAPSRPAHGRAAHRTAIQSGEYGRAVEVNEMTLDSASYVLEYEFDA